MTGSDGAVVVSVTGGVTGVSATYERLLALAVTLEAAAERMRGWAVRGAAVLVDGDLLASGLLAPLSLAEAEVAVVTATTGPDGVLTESAGWWLDAEALRLAVRLLQEADELAGHSLAAIDHALGRALGQTLAAGAPLWVPALAGGLTTAALLWPQVPEPGRDLLLERLDGEGDDLQEWVTEHPRLVERLAAGGGGLVDGLRGAGLPVGPAAPLPPLGLLGLLGLLPPTRDTAAAARLLARAYSPGRPRTRALPGVTVPASAQRPGSVEDLVEHLAQLSELSAPGRPDMNGTIEVQSFTGDDGVARHVVYLPGTDDMTTWPWTQDDDVRDMGANLALVGDQPTAYGAGVLEAMQAAGIGPDEPVLLAGHSQGGLQAAQLLDEQHGYRVTHVVTAGSPTAHLGPFPDGSHVLSLEQRGDVVPLLDGAPNPDSPEQVTLTFEAGPLAGRDVAGHHGFAAYAAGAAAADASTHPGVQEQVRSLHDSGFLGAQPPDGVRHGVYRITREP